jgi:hypothetical protein
VFWNSDLVLNTAAVLFIHHDWQGCMWNGPVRRLL